MLPRCSKYFSCGGDRNPSLLGCSALPGRYKDQVINPASALVHTSLRNMPPPVHRGALRLLKSKLFDCTHHLLTA
uniref:AlNc14C454G11749 protein n=1 Tax=Albugo laibachii Nc14 TaxID=890382 RepID=F0X008_9STRA|nr:AlNc14C454G11749 [Albugo laibachii Nc14]|eukprot:CCA27089.1 AlNc14C454G11749 [Albugo laibachii Nc14]